MQYSNILNVLPSVRNHKSGAALVAGVLATGLLLGPGMASAATVKTTGDKDEIATAIFNLDVNGALYNVDFERTTANDIYGKRPRTFDFDKLSDAEAANDAIIKALIAHSSAPLIGSDVLLVGDDFGILGNTSRQYNIGWSDLNPPATDGIRGVAGTYLAEWTNSGSRNRSFDEIVFYADFSPVPVPAAVWLFGSGLLGLIGVARRKKSA
jgi:hypothetical protein